MDKACRCPNGPYQGARLAGTPDICERCRGLVDEEAKRTLQKVHAESLVRLEKWAKENPMESGI